MVGRKKPSKSYLLMWMLVPIILGPDRKIPPQAKFKGPKEWLPHLLWLFQQPNDSRCPCKFCPPEGRPTYPNDVRTLLQFNLQPQFIQQLVQGDILSPGLPRLGELVWGPRPSSDTMSSARYTPAIISGWTSPQEVVLYYLPIEDEPKTSVMDPTLVLPFRSLIINDLDNSPSEGSNVQQGEYDRVSPHSSEYLNYLIP